MKQKLTFVMVIIVVVLLVMIANLNGIAALAQNVKCYTQQGGAAVVAGSGCSYTFQSGSSLTIASGATVNASGILTQGAVIEGLKVSLPVAATTATPAAIIDSAAAGNLLEVKKSATDVFKIGNGGVVTGLVLQYGTAGQKVVCGSTTVTGTGTLPTTLSTPVAVNVNLTGPVTGDGYTVVYTNTAGVVTAGVFGNQATPAAATTPRAVAWCALGTP